MKFALILIVALFCSISLFGSGKKSEHPFGSSDDMESIVNRVGHKAEVRAAGTTPPTTPASTTPEKDRPQKKQRIEDTSEQVSIGHLTYTIVAHALFLREKQKSEIITDQLDPNYDCEYIVIEKEDGTLFVQATVIDKAELKNQFRSEGAPHSSVYTASQIIKEFKKRGHSSFAHEITVDQFKCTYKNGALSGLIYRCVATNISKQILEQVQTIEKQKHPITSE